MKTHNVFVAVVVVLLLAGTSIATTVPFGPQQGTEENGLNTEATTASATVTGLVESILQEPRPHRQGPYMSWNGSACWVINMPGVAIPYDCDIFLR